MFMTLLTTKTFFKESLPGVADFLDNLGIETDNNLFEVIGGGVQSFKEDSSYPLARSIAEYLMPEGSDNSMLINFTVPAEDEVMDLVLPEPRPDLELAEADDYKFPNVPFTEERKGMFDEFMNFIFPPAQASTLQEPSVPTQEVVEETKPMSFGDTFKQARADGLNTFSFKGKEYTTEVAQ
jgi:hypothetical protein